MAVLREAPSNAARHAQLPGRRSPWPADRAGDLVLTVQDDGAGSPGGRRSGLANLAERAARSAGASS